MKRYVSNCASPAGHETYGALNTMKACPACGTPPARTLHYPEGTMHLCATCGLQWATRDDTSLVNENDSHYYTGLAASTDTYRPFLDFAQRMTALRGAGPLRILDVGCGAGDFIRFALARGHEVEGIEPDACARRLMDEGTAARVRFCRVEETDYPAASFDVMTFWDSFEHIEAGFELLDKTRRWLRPGGTVFLRVNNTRDVLNMASGVLLRAVPSLGHGFQKRCFNFPSHVWNFNEKAMRLLVDRHGWRIAGHRITDTPAERLFTSPALRMAAKAVYLVHRCIGGGKIGEYYITPTDR